MPSCFFGESLVKIVEADGSRGFEFVNDATRQRGKWGFVANSSGATLRLRIDPRSVILPEQVGQRRRLEAVVIKMGIKQYDHDKIVT